MNISKTLVGVYGVVALTILSACKGDVAPIKDGAPEIVVKKFKNVTETSAAHDFQKDADIIRLKHLQYYGELIEEYHEKTGGYPFMDEADIPLYVFVASSVQIEFVQGEPPHEHKKKSFKAWVLELEKGLGREILEYYDPQFAPENKPNFYIYMANKQTYYFAIHVSQAYPFANEIAPGYNKIEISNTANAKNKAKSPKDLFASQDFKDAVSKDIMKQDFFEKREQLFLRETKKP